MMYSTLARIDNIILGTRNINDNDETMYSTLARIDIIILGTRVIMMG